MDETWVRLSLAAAAVGVVWLMLTGAWWQFVPIGLAVGTVYLFVKFSKDAT